ncbi:MAG: signal peptidase I [Lachnospiraceae bacterium]|jgi:signal peptidase I|nr:signal peptidase I [Lachnospiraceae bacterium]MEE3460918.1 signal peptidase I [Lachnospiraceae bacterium]
MNDKELSDNTDPSVIASERASEKNDPSNEENLEENSEVKSEDKSEENAEKKPEKASKTSWVEYVIYGIILILCITVVPKYVVQRTIVSGKSMMDNFQNGDNLIVEKVSYRFHDPKRFDVVVFYPYGRDDPSYYIKRIIGLPGETVQIKGPDIYIDGKKLEEHYGKDPITTAGIAKKPLKLGDDEFFVLGDNRRISEDSRYPEVGPVKRKNIEGRAILRIYPFRSFGKIQ